MVLRFHVENLERMNELFGFSYCEALVKAILEYLPGRDRLHRCTAMWAWNLRSASS
ncbi:MAG: hypothetical protein ACLUD2_03210 [Clostridium sp.]